MVCRLLGNAPALRDAVGAPPRDALGAPSEKAYELDRRARALAPRHGTGGARLSGRPVARDTGGRSLPRGRARPEISRCRPPRRRRPARGALRHRSRRGAHGSSGSVGRVRGGARHVLERRPAARGTSARVEIETGIRKRNEEPTSMTQTLGIAWKTARAFTDIRYEKAEGIAKITINRPDVRNAFRPLTVREMIQAFEDVREDPEIGVAILTGEGHEAFCSGGDQRVRGDKGYVGEDKVPRLNVLDLQKQIRSLPKPVVAMVAGFAIGGGHVLHVVCDLSIAADNARFGQTGPRVGSFDGGFGSSTLASMVGLKKAKEIWFLCRQYDAQQALQMGLVNAVVPLDKLEEETVQWCQEMLALSPMALRLLKSSFNAALDGQAGVQELAGNATLLFYMTEEAKEGRDAFKEKRKPDFAKFPRRP